MSLMDECGHVITKGRKAHSVLYVTVTVWLVRSESHAVLQTVVLSVRLFVF